MTKEEKAKEYLESAYYTKMFIGRIEAEQKAVKAEIQRNKRPTLKALGECLEKILEDEKVQYDERIALIRSVGDERCRTVLSFRYERHFQWEKIALEMHYDVRTVQKLNVRALGIIADQIGFLDDSGKQN